MNGDASASSRRLDRAICALGAAYLIVEAAALAAYWFMLWTRPESRAPFLVGGAGDAMLLGFSLPDLALYAPTGLAGAWGLVRRTRWARFVLVAHAGAAMYGALYALLLGFIAGRWLGAAMMAPALVVPWFLAWWSGRAGAGSLAAARTTLPA